MKNDKHNDDDDDDEEEVEHLLKVMLFAWVLSQISIRRVKLNHIIR